MGALFFAVADDKSAGIISKAVCQAKSISGTYGFCDLLFYKGSSVVCERYNAEAKIREKVVLENAEGKYLAKTTSVQLAALKMIQSGTYEVVYFRDQLWTRYMSRILVYTRRNHIKTYMEIPTYPYYKEQLAVASNKPKALATVIFSYVSDLRYFRLVDHIPVIIANSKKRLTAKMIPMVNGADIDCFSVKPRKEADDINIVGVGYLSVYHGFEKVIRSMAEYYRNGGSRRILFYIAGEGPQKPLLQELADKSGLHNKVIFLGKLNKEELEKLYEKASISVGTLSLHKRGADTDTSLKTIEALVQGIPVILSGKIADRMAYDSMAFHISTKDDSFDMNELCRFLDKYNVSVQDIDSLRERYDWKSVMSSIIA